MSDWAEWVCKLAQTSDGVDRALMPSSFPGETWSFVPRDDTTRQITLFADEDDE